MPEDSDDADASADRRLFGDERATTVGYVASEMGLVRIELTADRIGNYSLLERGTVTAVDTDNQTVVAATAEDVRLDTEDAGECLALGFGEATAVGIDDPTVYAARPTGEIGRLDDVDAWNWRLTDDGVHADAGVQADAGIQGDASIQGGGPDDQDRDTKPSWQILGTVDGPVSIDGPLVAAASGVYRLGETIEPLGLDSVNDVTQCPSTGEILAATQDGLYRSADDGDSWENVSTDAVSRVLSVEQGYLAVTDDGTVEQYDNTGGTRVDGLTEPVVDIAQGESLYAVTAAGDLFMAADPDQTTDGYDGWRSQPVGVRGVVGIALLDG